MKSRNLYEWSQFFLECCFSYASYSLNTSLPVEIIKKAAPDISGIPEIKHQNFPLKYDTII
jgi:hypothetical protein